jgi:cyanophycinase-like exopeptidase
VALHGGGELVAGDEPAMDALVAAAVEASGGGRPARVVVVPAAVARHRPELAVREATRSFEAAARRAGAALDVDVAMVVDAASASDERVAPTLEAADLVYLPGGDPDVIPSVLPGSPAWSAMSRAYARGACLAGASAGAMALCERLWTAGGPMAGLGVVPGAAVLPHFAPGRARGWRSSVDPAGELAWIGLEERTMVIGRPGGGWRVAGAGRAFLLPPGADAPSVGAGHGEPFPLGARSAG